MTLPVRRLKTIALSASLLFSALILLAWAQTWFTLELSTQDSATTQLSIGGAAAAPDLSALSLASLALAGALAIAGPVVRIVFGVIQLLIGAGIVASSLIAMASPIASSATVLTKATGVSGSAALSTLVNGVDQTAWPWCAVVFGVVLGLIGVFTTFTTRQWPSGPRRYESNHTDEGAGSGGSVSDWDELSAGDDPTTR